MLEYGNPTAYVILGSGISTLGEACRSVVIGWLVFHLLVFRVMSIVSVLAGRVYIYMYAPLVSLRYYHQYNHRILHLFTSAIELDHYGEECLFLTD